MDVKAIIIAIVVLAVLGLVLGVLIGVAAKFLTVEEDPRIEKISSMLPGANCGGCGFPGCSGMADAIVNNGVDPKNCKPGKPEMVEAIKAYLKAYDEEHKAE